MTVVAPRLPALIRHHRAGQLRVDPDGDTGRNALPGTAALTAARDTHGSYGVHAVMVAFDTSHWYADAGRKATPQDKLRG
ncbi:MAG: hypothetical protein M3070_04175 [Actinomycetota bacterium]|nr:hypothetical protein [Actinomycetota bacterium]